ncbi:unnamed protein product [Ambrosiozyma monospora]|uniref:Unnamed protein product n=1 Tax=Ambrosiozyma monospora TaxID=43982 RepID=A0ACB5SZ27_AMBMO|nr:unnamed protein product [Ambrosiozyma monospora]
MAASTQYNLHHLKEIEKFDLETVVDIMSGMKDTHHVSQELHNLINSSDNGAGDDELEWSHSLGAMTEIGN